MIKACPKGHTFQKTSDCPICPICWSSFYKDKLRGEFPKKLGAPALRALLNEKITNLKKLSKYTEKEVLALHGMGPASIPVLKAAMKVKGVEFKK